eukprot:4018201-Pyramimonas_sp.AAC.2
MKLSDLIWLFHTVYSTITLNFENSLTAEYVSLAMMCALEFTVPLDKADDVGYVAPLELNCSSETQAKLGSKINNLLAPMKLSLLYKKSAKRKAEDAEGDDAGDADGHDAPAPKKAKAKGAAGKSKAKPKAKA